MKNKKVDCIVCIILGSIFLCIGIAVIIVTFSGEDNPMGWFGVMYFYLGLIFLIGGIYFLDKHKKQEVTEKLERQKRVEKFEQKKFILARELMVAYYMDLAEKSLEDAEENTKDFFNEKYNLIKNALTSFIIQQENKYGTEFLTEDPDKNEISRTINSIIGKQAFGLLAYYLLEFDISLPLHSRQELVDAIILAQEEDPTADDNNFKMSIFKHLKSKSSNKQ